MASLQDTREAALIDACHVAALQDDRYESQKVYDRRKHQETCESERKQWDGLMLKADALVAASAPALKKAGFGSFQPNYSHYDSADLGSWSLNGVDPYGASIKLIRERSNVGYYHNGYTGEMKLKVEYPRALRYGTKPESLAKAIAQVKQYVEGQQAKVDRADKANKDLVRTSKQLIEAIEKAYPKLCRVESHWDVKGSEYCVWNDYKDGLCVALPGGVTIHVDAATGKATKIMMGASCTIGAALDIVKKMEAR